jgi:hypothetical protein
MSKAPWIVTCALAVIGAFFLVLRISWLAHLDTTWLPYAAHGVGALLAGLMIGFAAKPTSVRDAAIGGAIAIGILAAVAFGMPRAFGWVAVRSTQPALSALGIAAGSAALCGAGYWLAREQGDRSPIAILVLAAFVTACTVMLGGQIAVGLGMDATLTMVTIAAAVLAFAAGYATQAIVSGRRVALAGSGMGVLLVFQVIEVGVKGLTVDKSLFMLAVPWLAGIIGAHLSAKDR